MDESDTEIDTEFDTEIGTEYSRKPMNCLYKIYWESWEVCQVNIFLYFYHRLTSYLNNFICSHTGIKTKLLIDLGGVGVFYYICLCLIDVLISSECLGGVSGVMLVWLAVMCVNTQRIKCHTLTCSRIWLNNSCTNVVMMFGLHILIGAWWTGSKIQGHGVCLLASQLWTKYDWGWYSNR